ncbi:S-layer homology domain-containing protein [Paenibacillus glycanilyticus]|nr:S-layer homology domain-containing protein [Paenibacillus glycanilyticus]
MKARKLFLYFVFCLCLVYPMASSAADAAATQTKLVLSAKPNGAAAGEEIQIRVTASSLNDAYGFELKLAYDTGKLRFVKADSSWSGMSVTPQDKDGVITFAHSLVGSVNKAIDGTSVLATFTFKGIKEGASSISLQSARVINSAVQAESVSATAPLKVVIASGSSHFTDMTGHWAEKAAARAAALGIVTGYSDGRFHPNENVTRAQFAAMIIRMIEPVVTESPAGTASFADAKDIPAWAAAAVGQASAKGIVNGYKDGSFRPASFVSRAEIAAMVIRASGESWDDSAVPAFADANRIPEWAKPAVAKAYELGLMQGRGDNRFEPDAFATRAEAVTLLLNYYDQN